MHNTHKKDNYCSLTHWPVGICLICTYILWKTWLISQMPSDKGSWRWGVLWGICCQGFWLASLSLWVLELLSLNWDLGLQRKPQSKDGKGMWILLHSCVQNYCHLQRVVENCGITVCGVHCEVHKVRQHDGLNSMNFYTYTPRYSVVEACF